MAWSINFNDWECWPICWGYNVAVNDNNGASLQNLNITCYKVVSISETHLQFHSWRCFKSWQNHLPYTHRNDRQDCHSGQSYLQTRWCCGRVCSSRHTDHCWPGWRPGGQQRHQRCSLLRSNPRHTDTSLETINLVNPVKCHVTICNLVPENHFPPTTQIEDEAGFYPSCSLRSLRCCTPLTFATLAVTTAIIKTEKIHDILRWQRVRGGGIHRPQGCVGSHHAPALLLQPVQMQSRVPSVTRILKYF